MHPTVSTQLYLRISIFLHLSRSETRVSPRCRALFDMNSVQHGYRFVTMDGTDLAEEPPLHAYRMYRMHTHCRKYGYPLVTRVKEYDGMHNSG